MQRDPDFGRKIWVKALKVVLNQICCFRVRSLLCNRSAVSRECSG